MGKNKQDMKVQKRQSNNAVIRPSPWLSSLWVSTLYLMDILSTRDTYRLALKGSLTLSPLVLTDYRFSLTVLLLLRQRISVLGENAAHAWLPKVTVHIIINISPNAVAGVLQNLSCHDVPILFPFSSSPRPRSSAEKTQSLFLMNDVSVRSQTLE